jgi:hypothetical protein
MRMVAGDGAKIYHPKLIKRSGINKPKGSMIIKKMDYDLV